ncbi:hypothetical protein X798_02960 [Onchocerca flexuosa]|uniref:Big_5 domain-containing protein n=2 Tax=Onchocerca flexuosa TaxID=387005 RepID=A0A183H5V5_9BILA|nr:hypothetical protein X798_02960 [Onchocerca flexuosa]VDO34478.1 unnamed protein product [Onchocerca flexuosa]
MVNNAATQQNTLKMIRINADNPVTNSNEPLKIETFLPIELPTTKPDTNGTHHYSFTIEFEAPKELLLSNKPKFIDLQLEAVLEGQNQ